MVSAITSTAAASTLLAAGQVLSLLGIREQIEKRVLYDGDCSHRHERHLGMVVAGQMVNDLVTMFFLSGFLTPARSLAHFAGPGSSESE
jgi:hypothetical protein